MVMRGQCRRAITRPPFPGFINALLASCRPATQAALRVRRSRAVPNRIRPDAALLQIGLGILRGSCPERALPVHVPPPPVDSFTAGSRSASQHPVCAQPFRVAWPCEAELSLYFGIDRIEVCQAAQIGFARSNWLLQLIDRHHPR
jgi:hypothetical protein